VLGDAFVRLSHAGVCAAHARARGPRTTVRSSRRREKLQGVTSEDRAWTDVRDGPCRVGGVSCVYSQPVGCIVCAIVVLKLLLHASVPRLAGFSVITRVIT